MNTIHPSKHTFRRLALAVPAFVLAIGVAAPAMASTGPGTLTPALTSPVAVTGAGVSTTLSCTANTQAKTYVARIEPTQIQGYSVASAITVKGYTGPGTYSGTVTATVTGNGKTYGGAKQTTSVTITDAGGALQFSKTASGKNVPRAAGKTVAGSIAWTCPTA